MKVGTNIFIVFKTVKLSLLKPQEMKECIESCQTKVLKLYYRKNRDFAVIGFSLIYLINIIDANVDAHLRTFDVSDDLSIHLDPWQSTYKTNSGYRAATGLSVKLNFK